MKHKHKRFKFVYYFLVIALVIVGSTGCEEENPDDVDEYEDQYAPFPLFSATRGYWTENEGPGTNWYDYHFSDQSHALVPKLFVYAIEDPVENKTFFFTPTSYAGGADKITGFFTLDIATDDGPVKTLVSDVHIYGKRTCVDFTKEAYVDCENQDYDVMLAGPSRPVAEAGMAPQGGAIFVAPKNKRKTYAIPASKIKYVKRANNEWKEVKGVQEAEYLPNAYLNTDESRLKGATTNGKVQITIRATQLPPTTITEQTNSYEVVPMVTAWIYKLNTADGSASIEMLGPEENRLEGKSLKQSKVQTLDLGVLDKDSVYLVDFYEFKKSKKTDKCLFKLSGGLPNGLWPLRRVTLQKIGKMEADRESKLMANYDLIIKVDSTGKHALILGPSAVSWAYGEKEDVSELDKVKDVQLFGRGNAGEIPYGI